MSDINQVSVDESVEVLSDTINILITLGINRPKLIQRPELTPKPLNVYLPSSSYNDSGPDETLELEALPGLDHQDLKNLEENFTDITFKKQKKTQSNFSFDDHLNNHPNVANENTSELVRKFNLKSLPPLSINEYILRLQKYLKFSTSVLVAASYYVCKLLDIVPDACLTQLNSYRIVLTALRISSKFTEDMNHTSKVYSQVAGIKKLELSKLELLFLFLVDFDLKVDATILNNYLLGYRALKQSQIDMNDSANDHNTNDTPETGPA